MDVNDLTPRNAPRRSASPRAKTWIQNTLLCMLIAFSIWSLVQLDFSQPWADFPAAIDRTLERVGAR